MSHTSSDIADLDAWIQLLMSCKQLAENDVKKLCEKVVWEANFKGTRNPDGGKQCSGR
jgi:hypothetical protein